MHYSNTCESIQFLNLKVKELYASTGIGIVHLGPSDIPIRWSFRGFQGCKDNYFSSCDLSEYYCPYDWSRYIEPP